MRRQEKSWEEVREKGRGKRKEQEVLIFIVLEARKSKIEGPTCHFKNCFEDFIFNHVCVHICVGVCMGAWVSWRPEEGVRSLGA